MLKTVIVAVVTIAPLAIAQTPSDTRTIDMLLTEVRQLRLAIERSTLLNAKVQLAIQRLALQDQRVARLSAQLEAVRKDIGAQTNQINHAKDQIQNVEQQISSESDTRRRKSLDEELQQLKLIAVRAVDSQLLARESELATALQYERSVAQEITDKITAIERLLDPTPVLK